MISFTFVLLLVCVLPKLTCGMKVDMQGAVSLGKEVMDTLSHYIEQNKIDRRKMVYFRQNQANENSDDDDAITVMVNGEELCGDIKFCQGDVGIFLNSYVIMLTKAVESIFEGLVGANRQNDDTSKPILFEKELKRIMEDIKKLLVKVNEKITKAKEAFMWTDLMKRINAKFLDQADVYALLRLEGNEEITEVKKKLTQKIIIATSLVELEFENRLCSEHNICAKNFKCTKALDILLERMNTEVPGERVKEFIKYFYETLPGTNFYYRITDTTGKEFQKILYDMAYQNIGTQSVLSSVHRIVQDRLNVVTSDFKQPYSATGWDVKLVHIILSDMDHFYSNKQKEEPFHDFLSDFFEWSKSGDRFSSPLRKLLKDIQNMLSFELDELVLKLVNEMKVFMEITIDPDP